VRCARCGNENPETNRFCGFCGATLGQAASTVASSTLQTPAPSLPTTRAKPAEDPVADAPAPVAPRPPASQESPVISGPSFLGLNDPAPSPRRRGSLSIDPHSAPSSRDLKYLLDDEEEHTGGSAWKFVLIVLALVLAVGFGYLRWKDQGFAWLNASPKKPAASAQSSDSADAGSASPPSSSPAPSADSSGAPAPSTPQPATGTKPAPTPSPSPASAAPGNSPDAPVPTAPAAASSSTPQPSAASAPRATSASGSAAPPDGSAAATPPASSKDADDSADNPPAATEQPKPAPPGPAPKPRPAVIRDPVGEAQKYLYGKGATQDCDRGLRLLKPAADQGTPKAMIEMGALYSAGLCTPRDLPTAYRWFALALRKDPDNQAVQTDLQKLWGEMTQPERQLAIRLSQ
jgi:hypothetical protein